MPLTLKQTAAPTEEPVSLAMARLHCRVDGAEEDALLGTLIAAARQWCESWTGRALCTQTWRLSLDRFPLTRGEGLAQREQWGDAPGTGGVIRLPRPALIAVTAVEYVDTAGVLRTLAADQVLVGADEEPARLTPAYGLIWPVPRWQADAVRVTYTAGYGAAAAVPEAIKQAMLLLVGHWYRNREAVALGTTSTPVQFSVEALLTPFWVGEYR